MHILNAIVFVVLFLVLFGIAFYVLFHDVKSKDDYDDIGPRVIILFLLTFGMAAILMMLNDVMQSVDVLTILLGVIGIIVVLGICKVLAKYIMLFFNVDGMTTSFILLFLVAGCCAVGCIVLL